MTTATHQAAPPTTALGKRAVIIIGMHRSGTSATTGALKCLGVELSGKLYRGHQQINAKGYFEHSDIADTHDEILWSLGSAWDDVLPKAENWWAEDCLAPFAVKVRNYIRRDFSRSVLWAVKDPRVCRLLPWWLNILKDEGISPHFLFVVRSPDEVYRSLERRDGFSREKSFLLWTRHYLEAERESRGFPRAFTLFDRFLENPKLELSRIERQLKLQFPVPVSVAAECLKQFLSKDLRHHRGREEFLPVSLVTTLTYSLEAQLQQAAQEMGDQASQINTDDLWQKLGEIERGFPPLLVEQLQSVTRQRGQLDLTVHRLVRSWSWSIGKPVRFVERLLGRDV